MQLPPPGLRVLAALADSTFPFAAAAAIPRMAAAAPVAGLAVSPALITSFTLTERLPPWVSPDRGIRAAQRGHRDRPGARILHHRPRRGRRRPTNDASDCRAARRARHAGPTLAEQPSHLRQRRDSAITTPATQGARIWKIWVKLPARTARLSCAQNRRCADVGTTPITSGVATVSAVRASAYRSSGYARQIAGRGNPHA